MKHCECGTQMTLAARLVPRPVKYTWECPVCKATLDGEVPEIEERIGTQILDALCTIAYGGNSDRRSCSQTPPEMEAKQKRRQDNETL